MKQIILLLLLIASGFANAQDNASTTDSIEYYQRQIGEKIRAHHEVLRKDEELKTLYERVGRLRSAQDSYRGFILYSHLASVNFSKMNADLSSEGFTPLSGPLWAIGYGFTFKKNRRIFDFNMGAIGINRKTAINDESIKSSFSTALELAWGYDFIKSKALNIYPYAGVGLRSTYIRYEAIAEINPSGTNITNIVLSDPSLTGQTTEVGYLAGLGIEVVITSAKRPGGTLIFVKAGTNRPFSTKSFDLKGYKYDPELKAGALIVSTGFKFFFR